MERTIKGTLKVASKEMEFSNAGDEKIGIVKNVHREAEDRRLRTRLGETKGNNRQASQSLGPRQEKGKTRMLKIIQILKNRVYYSVEK